MSFRWWAIIFTVLLIAMALLVSLNSVPRKVHLFISQAVTADTWEEQQAAFDALVGLGCKAVPAIVNALNDDRPLRFPALRLWNNSQDAFEAFRHYSPDTMTDALAAILNDITGHSFGSIYNGSSPSDRADEVKGWRTLINEHSLADICVL